MFEAEIVSSLLEKGLQMLIKDNLIDEEKAKQEEAAQENLLQKIDRLVPARQPLTDIFIDIL